MELGEDRNILVGALDGIEADVEVGQEPPGGGHPTAHARFADPGVRAGASMAFE